MSLALLSVILQEESHTIGLLTIQIEKYENIKSNSKPHLTKPVYDHDATPFDALVKCKFGTLDLVLRLRPKQSAAHYFSSNFASPIKWFIRFLNTGFGISNTRTSLKGEIKKLKIFELSSGVINDNGFLTP